MLLSKLYEHKRVVESSTCTFLQASLHFPGGTAAVVLASKEVLEGAIKTETMSRSRLKLAH